MKNKIDVHAHYMPPAYAQLLKKKNLTKLDGGVSVPAWGEEIQLEIMEQLSISYSFLSISSPHLHMGDRGEAVETARASNEYGKEFKKKYPEKIGIFASLPLPEITESVEEIQYCRDILNLDGFSVFTNSCGMYLGSPALDPVMEELDKAGAVVSIHPTKPSVVPEGISAQLIYPAMEFFFDTTRAIANMVMNGIFKRYPNIKWIVPHAGAFVPILSDRLSAVTKIFGAEDPDAENALAGLYYDLAGFSMPKQLGVLRMITDDTHLLYGSDCTFTPLGTCEKLEKDMNDCLDEKLKDIIFQKNVRSLFPYI